MECGICLHNYDARYHIPTLLDCGHTFCNKCIEDIIIGDLKVEDLLFQSQEKLCPVDHRPFSTRFVPNYELLTTLSLCPIASDAHAADFHQKHRTVFQRQASERASFAQLFPGIDRRLIAEIFNLSVQKAIENELKCTNGHNLNRSDNFIAEYQSNEFIFKCRLCNRDKTLGWLCKPCIYIICDECKEWMTETDKIENSGVLCLRRHKLRMTPNAQVYNLKIGRGSGNFNCDACLERRIGWSAQCRECNFDMCESCTESLKRIVPLVGHLKCLRNHPLVWIPDFCAIRNKDYGCDVCKRRFKKSGSFNCGLCKFDVCITCADRRLAEIRGSTPK